MYGLLIEMLRKYIEPTFGSVVWLASLEQATGQQLEIDLRHYYKKAVLDKLLIGLSDFIGLPIEDLLFEAGYSSINFMAENGYLGVLKVLGRNFLHFLNNLDELHEYLRFSYPRLKAPGFTVISVTGNVITILYTSIRNQFSEYVRGQLTNVAYMFFNLDITIKTVEEIRCGVRYGYYFKIYNKGIPWTTLLEKTGDLSKTSSLNLSIDVSEKSFFEIFPFHLVFTRDLMIRRAGTGMSKFSASLVGKHLLELFHIVRPQIEAKFDDIILNRHTTFEIALLNKKKNKERSKSKNKNQSPQFMCRFKGQIFHVEEWDMIMFLGSPQIRDSKELFNHNLRVSDLNMFDRSREVILEGSQQSDELMNLFQKQHEKSKQMEKSMINLNNMKKVTDDLLYQCIPRSVGRKLRQGTPAIETIQNFEEVSICFTKVVEFGANCLKIGVHQVVNLLNRMYSLYDALTEKHKVYKVETVSDSYMIVSGAPHRTPFHSAHLANIALDILDTTQRALFWPEAIDKVPPDTKETVFTDQALQLYIGGNTGPIVAGIVGFKTPRYCLFGDTVNTSSRMMSHGVAKVERSANILLKFIDKLEFPIIRNRSAIKLSKSGNMPDKLHVSKSFADAISKFPYIIESRGEVQIKGKGPMETFFVTSRNTEYTIDDPQTGERRNFQELLNEDILNGDDASEADSGEASLHISTEFTQDNEGSDEMEMPTPTSSGEQDTPKLSPPKADKQTDKDTKIAAEVTKEATIQEKENSKVADTNDANSEQRKSSISASSVDPNTTDVLNQAAKRLMEDRVSEIKKQKKGNQQSIIFDEEQKEQNGEEEQENLEKTESQQPISDVDAATNRQRGRQQRTRLIKNQTNTLSTSASRKSMQVQGKSNQVEETGNMEDSNEQKNDNQDENNKRIQKYQPIKQDDRYQNISNLPICSPQAALIRDLACNFFRKVDQNITEFWTDNLRKFRELGC